MVDLNLPKKNLRTGGPPHGDESAPHPAKHESVEVSLPNYQRVAFAIAECRVESDSATAEIRRQAFDHVKGQVAVEAVITGFAGGILGRALIRR